MNYRIAINIDRIMCFDTVLIKNYKKIEKCEYEISY